MNVRVALVGTAPRAVRSADATARTPSPHCREGRPPCRPQSHLVGTAPRAVRSVGWRAALAPRAVRWFVAAFFLAAALPLLAIESQPLAVAPFGRYLLTYDWSVEGSPRDFAEDPDGPAKVFRYRGSDYPVQRLVFSDASGASLGANAGLQSLVPGRAGRMAYEFHAPAGAVSLTLRVSNSAGGKVAVSNVVLQAVANAPTVNVNPDFSLGLYNYSGVASANDGALRLVMGDDGRPRLFTGFYCMTSAAPVTPGRSYRLKMAARGHHKNRMDSFLVFSGADGKTVAKSSLPRISKGKSEAPVEMECPFTPPDGAAWVHLWIYDGTLEYVRITAD